MSSFFITLKTAAEIFFILHVNVLKHIKIRRYTDETERNVHTHD